MEHDQQQIPGQGQASRSGGDVLKSLPKNILYLAAAGIVAFFLAIVFWVIGSNDDATAHAEAWNEAAQKWNETDTYLDMDDINLDIDIVPSPKFERVIDYLRCENAVPFTNSKIEELSSRYPYDECMFIFKNNTDIYFPTLVTTDEMLPTGNSTSRCLTLSWAYNNAVEVSRANIWESYTPIENFPECENYEAQKTMWPDYVPKNGVSINPWIQYDICTGRTDRHCKKTCEKEGGFLFYRKKTIHKLSVTPEPVCYGYKILKKVCVAVKRERGILGGDYWTYDGGCFKNSEGGDSPSWEKFEKVEAGKTYRMEDVKIFILNSEDPYLTMLRESGEEGYTGSDYTLIRIFGWLFFLAALGCLGFVGFFFYKQNQATSGPGSQELVSK